MCVVTLNMYTELKDFIAEYPGRGHHDWDRGKQGRTQFMEEVRGKVDTRVHQILITFESMPSR